MRIGDSKNYPGTKAAFLTRGVKKGQVFAAMPGWNYVRGDPNIPEDNSYQVSIPGTNLITDAKGMDQSAGKAPFLNDGLKNDAKCRIRQAPDGANYCLAYALHDYKIHEEMETTYDREYWLRKIQWVKLSEKDQAIAAKFYKIVAPDMLI